MSTRKPDALAVLDANQVRYVRVHFTDCNGTLRYKILPVNTFKKACEAQIPGINLPVASLGAVFITLADGFHPIGEYFYEFDLSTLRVATYALGHATIVGSFKKRGYLNPKVPKYIHEPLCPRSTLARALSLAKNTFDVEFLVGFELEFILLKSTDPIVSANQYKWHEAAAITGDPAVARTLEEIADAIQAAGIELCCYHSEAAPGQFEFSTGPLPPMQSADTLLITREIILTIAAKNGYKATFAPRVHFDNCGSANHTHISLKARDSNSYLNKPVTPPIPQAPQITVAEASFLQSLLDHLPALIPFTMPQKASYSRMTDFIWSGGTFVAWGFDNRETPIRLTGPPGGYHLELRAIDGTASAHVALAAVIHAGLLGLPSKASGVDNVKLRYPGQDSVVAQLSDQDRKAAGVTERLPLSVETARSALLKDEKLVQSLGADFVNGYLALNKTLNEQMDTGNSETDLKLLVETY